MERSPGDGLDTIIYTHTDEAPLLATYSFLPIIQAYAATAGVRVETRDISLAGPDHRRRSPTGSTDEQRIDDALAELGELAKTPEANIIKLPNISASIPQLKAAIAELQAQGYALPDYPDDPKTDEEKDVRARYDKVKGSAVNPVLREGNSDRRAPASVKQYARNHPHSMGAWTPDSKTNVAHMTADDFRSNEKSAVIEADGIAAHRAGRRRRHHHRAARVGAGAGRRGRRRHRACASPRCASSSTAQIARAKAEGVLFSVHLKATMMKVSDPIIFGHVVRAFFPRLFAEYGDALAAAGLSPNDGLGGILKGLESLPQGAEIKAAVEPGLADGPALAMVDSDKGITNLHVPSDVIVDASMPAMIRTSRPHVGPGRRGGRHPRGHPRQQLRRHLPGRHRRLPRQRRLRPGDDGLGAQRRPDGPGGRGVRLPRQDLRDPGRRHRPRRRRVRRPRCSSTRSAPGDIWRMCQTKDVPIRDWVKLAVTRARATGDPAVFWLDEGRAHDANLIAKVNAVPARARHRRAWTSRSWRRSTRSRSRSSASAAARTPSR